MMKLIITLMAFIALTRAGQIYQGTTQSIDGNNYQTAEINQLANQQQSTHQSDQYQADTFNNYQTNSVLNNARILSYQSDKSDYGYQYGFETDNGIRAEEVGQYQGNSHVVQGSYSYTGDDGQVYTVTYTADEYGFHPQGAHLPTPPPTPEAILKSLEKNALDEANGIFDDGSYKENPRQYESVQQNEDLLNEYNQVQHQLTQSRPQYSQSQAHLGPSQQQYSQQLQYSQSPQQYSHDFQQQQLQIPSYQSSSLGQYQTTGSAAKFQPSAPAVKFQPSAAAVKLPASGASSYSSGNQFQGYQISAPSGSSHF